MLQCKVNKIHNAVQKYGLDGSKIMEPQGTELLSALAAGNQARIILEITTSHSQQQSVTPLTLGLAVAANQTQGKLICIRPSLHSCYGLEHVVEHENKHEHDCNANGSATELRVGDPCEVVTDIRNVDFAVIDCTNLDANRLRLLSDKLHLNPRGFIIVANNILHREQGVALVDQILKGKRGIQSSVTTLPLGSSPGFQLIIKVKSQKRRKHKRFFVTFDD